MKLFTNTTKSFLFCCVVPPYYIRINPPDNDIFSVGNNVTFLCEVPVGSNYGSPMWKLPSGAVIPEQGRIAFALFSFHSR